MLDAQSSGPESAPTPPVPVSSRPLENLRDTETVAVSESQGKRATSPIITLANLLRDRRAQGVRAELRAKVRALSYGARLVLFALASYAGPTGELPEQWTPTVEGLGDVAAVSSGVAKRALRELVRTELVHLDSGAQERRRNRYRLPWVAEMPEPIKGPAKGHVGPAKGQLDTPTAKAAKGAAKRLLSGSSLIRSPEANDPSRLGSLSFTETPREPVPPTPSPSGVAPAVENHSTPARSCVPSSTTSEKAAHSGVGHGFETWEEVARQPACRKAARERVERAIANKTVRNVYVEQTIAHVLRAVVEAMGSKKGNGELKHTHDPVAMFARWVNQQNLNQQDVDVAAATVDALVDEAAMARESAARAQERAQERARQAEQEEARQIAAFEADRARRRAALLLRGAAA